MRAETVAADLVAVFGTACRVLLEGTEAVAAFRRAVGGTALVCLVVCAGSIPTNRWTIVWTAQRAFFVRAVSITTLGSAVV